MSDLIETMARAIADDHGMAKWWDDWVSSARAALAAIEAAGYRVVPLSFVEDALRCGASSIKGPAAATEARDDG